MGHPHAEKFIEILKNQGLEPTIGRGNDGRSTRIDVVNGNHKAIATVYDTGKIVIGGPASELKIFLDDIKTSIDRGIPISTTLPPETQAIPSKLSKSCSCFTDIASTYLIESISSFSGKNYLASAFLLGVASELVIRELFQAFIASIDDEGQRSKSAKEINQNQISKAFAEFRRRYDSAQPRPLPGHEIDPQVMGMFDFYRICRNEVGHPIIPSKLDETVMHAQFSMFYKYVGDVQRLIDWYSQNKITL